MARWAPRPGSASLILFEGRDTAGKGGAIQAIAAKLNPRQCRTVALAKPSEAEQGQWYFQRYACHLPAKGEIVLFDRSWYNRAGVEKVMGFATDAQVDAFLEAVPGFERQLVDDGILLFKYWLCCDQEEQEDASRSASPTRSSGGNCPRSTRLRATNMTITPGRARRCSRPATPGRRHGHWSISTTRSVVG